MNKRSNCQDYLAGCIPIAFNYNFMNVLCHVALTEFLMFIVYFTDSVCQCWQWEWANVCDKGSKVGYRWPNFKGMSQAIEPGIPSILLLLIFLCTVLRDEIKYFFQWLPTWLLRFVTIFLLSRKSRCLVNCRNGTLFNTLEVNWYCNIMVNVFPFLNFLLNASYPETLPWV